jgi:hypothetical protein
MAGHDDHGKELAAATKLSLDLQAVHLRHADVEQHAAALQVLGREQLDT